MSEGVNQLKTDRRIGIVRFPGTNCDRDVYWAAQNSGWAPSWLWHADRFDIRSVEAVIVPGGFSYGDYLRCGALAAKSPVMQDVVAFVKSGRPVLGICNGFQILCEVGLLPGALLKNASGCFVDQVSDLKLLNTKRSVWTVGCPQEIRLPVAHGEGRYFADQETLQELSEHEQVVCTYVKNPNGSVRDIAGICNRAGNVFGLMPHPERAMADWMGGCDGRSIIALSKGGA